MVLVDFNNVLFSVLSQQFSKEKIDINILRHMVLNVLRSYRKKYAQKYGELVLIMDGRENWRKDVFPYYKARRKISRDESKLDWPSIYIMMDQIRDELATHFPYKMIQVHKAESDDVIGVLATRFAIHEKILILSTDTDFIQLQRFPNVDQYSPVQKKWLKVTDPVKYLKEHIIEGDSDDDVPNIRSVDTSFIHKIKQKPITTKYKEKLLAFPNPDVMLEHNIISEFEHRNYKRNIQLIDLSHTPEPIRLNIIEEYDRQDEIKKPRGSLYKYFSEHKLRNLMPHIQDF